MTLVPWHKNFELGVAEVDFEHRELITLINESYAQAKQGGSSAEVMGYLGEIFEKISAHFALEEKLMRDLDYDEYGPHKEEHELLLDGIRDIMDAYMDAGKIDETHFGTLLKDWFVNHFSTRDARMHRLILHQSS